MILSKNSFFTTFQIYSKVGFDKTTHFGSKTRIGQCVIFIPNDDNSNFISPEPLDRSLEAM